MSKAEQDPCPECGRNMVVVGRSHRCPGPPRKPVNLMMNPEPEEKPKRKAVKKLPPMVHPGGEPIVGAQIDGVPAKKRGRPKKSTVDRKEYQRELMRKRRAKKTT